MYTKIRSAKFKAVGGSKPGTFSAVVAVYGNVDSAGDRIIEGAFDQSLKAWQALGDPIPIVLAHEWKDPFKHIGYAMPNKIKSVPGVGLVVEEGFLDVEDNPLARQVHKLMERRTLKEFSFGYGIPQGGQTKASDGAMDLRMLDLIEFGPCLKGVNDKTELLSIKSQLTHEGVYVPNFEERLERIEEMLMEDTKAASAGRARWRSQKRHPETGRWIDETSGVGFDGRKRKVNPEFGAAKVDDLRASLNRDEKLSGSAKFNLNQILSDAEEKFIAGDNAGGEALVRDVSSQQRSLQAYNATTKQPKPKPMPKPGRDYEILADISSPAKQYGRDARQVTHADYEANRDSIDKSGYKLTGVNGTHTIIGPKSDPSEPVDGRDANKFGFSNEGSSVPGTVSRDDQSDTDLSASKEDVEMVASNMDAAEAMLNSGDDPDNEDLDDLMGNLHVDMEQANFPPEVEKRYADLEKKWQDAMDSYDPGQADHDQKEIQAQADELGEPVMNPFTGEWVQPSKKGKKALTLDDQISTMQANAAILSSAYGLEAKGFDVSEAGAKMDETLRRLAELEGELL